MSVGVTEGQDPQPGGRMGNGCGSEENGREMAHGRLQKTLCCW